MYVKLIRKTILNDSQFNLIVFLTIFMALASEYFYRLVRDLPVRPVVQGDVTDKSGSSLALEKGRTKLTGLIRLFVIGAFVSCFSLFIR